MKIGNVTVNYCDGDLTTTLPHGGVVHAVAQDTEEYAAMAIRLGYPDIQSLNRDHDLVHSLLAYWLGLPCSPALQSAFSGEGIDKVTGAEEDAVLAIQKFANRVGIDLFNVAAACK
jgi:hypothetical protein